MASSTKRSWETGRIGPAIGVVAIHAVLGYALIAGLRVTLPARFADDSMIVVDLKPPPPPRPPEPPAPRHKPARQAGGTPAPKAHPHIPVPIPAEPAPPRLIAVPPVVTSGNPAGSGTGGAGSGAGGVGSGAGRGVGTGAGFSGARQIHGRFRNSDFPASAKGAGRLKIGVRFAVGPSGRVDRCEVTRPSGYPEVDAMTCRVIVDRYRFEPARDEQGLPVTEVLEEDYSWRMD